MEVKTLIIAVVVVAAAAIAIAPILTLNAMAAPNGSTQETCVHNGNGGTTQGACTGPGNNAQTQSTVKCQGKYISGTTCPPP
jgi:hypothetical protein